MEFKIISTLEQERKNAIDTLIHKVGLIRRAIFIGSADKEICWLCKSVVEAEEAILLLNKIIEDKKQNELLWGRL